MLVEALGTERLRNRLVAGTVQPVMRRTLALSLLVASAACSSESPPQPATPGPVHQPAPQTTTPAAGDTDPAGAVEQRCTTIFQTPLAGQTGARRTVMVLETGEEVAVFEPGEQMPPLDEIPGCEPE